MYVRTQRQTRVAVGTYDRNLDVGVAERAEYRTDRACTLEDHRTDATG